MTLLNSHDSKPRKPVAEASDAEGLPVGRSELVFIQRLSIVSAAAVLPPRELSQNQRFESPKKASQEQIDEHFACEVGVSAARVGGGDQRRQAPPIRRLEIGKCFETEQAKEFDVAQESVAKSESNSWSNGDFTSDYLPCSSGNSERSVENDVVEGERRLPEKAVSKRIGEIVGDDSIEATAANSKVRAFLFNASHHLIIYYSSVFERP
ncbi:hypothetical protein Acr_18g0011610 [Actinidia rufa]|uniref:Uncharacterized protein n=1 Tax=Actinidia rufa TaxID=165716 RepID=A0A7J0G884_9ERIC|nr:hypothetical protein Acr_18g0011610 [Actinidia rufa]